jgi:hypothetical protein
MPSQPVLLGNVAAVRRLQLRPLSRNAVASIVGDSGIDPDRLFATTAGNPFFVAEVLATGGKNIPPTVRDAVLARAAQLTPPARLVLEAAAVVTPPVETWLLAEVAGCARQLIDECVAAGMLQARPERLEFRHELARMAVEDSVAPGRRLQLHQRTLTASHGPARDSPGPCQAGAPRRGRRRRGRGPGPRGASGCPRRCVGRPSCGGGTIRPRLSADRQTARSRRG